MTVALKPIKPKKISDQVFDQLRELIFRGELKPGQKIMTERELSEALGVSRTSVRDAINKLVVMGLLEQRQGQGTFVCVPGKNSNPLAAVMRDQGASLIDLLEVRMGLECNTAAYAAQRAVDEDIQFLTKQISEMKKEVKTGGLGTEADVAFHMAISFATKNPLQVYTMKHFYDLLFHGINENLAQLYQEPGNIDKIISQHQNILDAIRKHDPEAAYGTMKRHINFVLEFLAPQPAV